VANAGNTTEVRDQVRSGYGQGCEVLSRRFRSKTQVRVTGLERVRDGRNHSRFAPGFRQESGRNSRTGFTVADVEAFCRDMSSNGVLFSMPPKKQDFGGVLAQFVDSEGAHCSVGAKAA